MPLPPYAPPIDEMSFLLGHVVPMSSLGRDDLDEGTVAAVLGEAAKLASGPLAALDAEGRGAEWTEQGVRTPKGYKEGYRAFCEGGWNAVPFDPAHGGQGLPWILSFPLQEMWQSASLSFGLCPLLTQGAVEAISTHAEEGLKAIYLPKLVSGEWTGTMNLTEPQAGSDLSLIRTRAERAGDGTFRLFGQKVFITYGDHDLSENIVHLVLARISGAPEGVAGISLFLVPKILPGGGQNDVACVSLEKKLGIHASPTCTMQFGDRGGAVGYLVGKENEGLKAMFTMMNNARLSVGLQGVAVAERAYQAAFLFAKGRIQGKSLTDKRTVAIIDHPDVRRMLLTMKVWTQAGRALAYEAALLLDRAKSGDADAQILVDLLTPVVKAGCTDMAVKVASIGIQVHGGLGFIEESGAPAFYKDARILPIYEGTNGIQAADLVFRKIVRDGGAGLRIWQKAAEETARLSGSALLEKALGDLREASVFLLENESHPECLAAVAQSFLSLFFVVAGGLCRRVWRFPPKNREARTKERQERRCRIFTKGMS